MPLITVVTAKEGGNEARTARAAVEISTIEVASVTEMTATAAHTKSATASAASGEGLMRDRDTADSQNRHDGRNFVQD